MLGNRSRMNSGGHGGQVQKHARLAARRRARGWIARATTSRGASEAQGMGRVHEALAPGVHEHGALAAERLGRSGSAGRSSSRTPSGGTAHTRGRSGGRPPGRPWRRRGPTLPGWLVVCRKIWPRPPARQDRLLRHDRPRTSPRRRVEDIGAEAGERLVLVGGVLGVVREGEQVDRRPSPPAG